MNEAPKLSIKRRIQTQAFKQKRLVEAFIVLTERCHLRCQQCYLVENPRDEMTTAQLFGVIEQLAEAGALGVVFTGGEPLLRRDIYDLLRHARAQGLVTSLFTAGTHCRAPERVAQLKEAGLKLASISLYAAEPAIHDAVTQIPGSFEKTIAGVENLIAAGIRVKLKFLQMGSNQEQFLPTYELAKSLGALFSVDFNLTACHDGRRDPLEMQLQEEAALQVHRTMMQVAPKSLGAITPSLKSPDGAACGAGHTRIVVGPDGATYPCMDFTESMGNILEQSFEEIWRGQAVADIRSIKRFADPICRVCPDRAFCQRCPSASFVDTGDPNRPSHNTCMTARVRRRAYEEQQAGLVDERAASYAVQATPPTQEPVLAAGGCGGCGSVQKEIERWLQAPSRFGPTSTQAAITEGREK